MDTAVYTAADPRYEVQMPVGYVPQTDDDLWDLVYLLWGVRIPREQVCEHHDKGLHGNTPFEAFADAYFARHPITVWKASRGLGGKSFLLALLSLTEMVTYGASCTILGGSGQQSTMVHAAMTELWNAPYAPLGLLLREPTHTSTRLMNGARATVLMASQTSVRGPHPQRLRLDEIDEMTLPILDASLGQPMAAKGIPAHVVMSSTWHNAEGTMTEIYNRAAENPSYGCYEWCYKESMTEWLNESDVETKRSTVTSLMWRVEYEGQRPSGGAVAIMPEAVDYTFAPEYGEFEGKPGEYIELEQPRFPVTKAAPYVTGVDWAKEADWTVISTWRTDVQPWRRIAWQRLGRQSWPSMVAASEERLERYGGVMLHDNTGLGDVIDDYINKNYRTQVVGINLVGHTRQAIFNEYVSSLEGEKMRGPKIKWAYDEHVNVSQNDLKGSGHPPDSVVADALAWHARNYEMQDDDWGMG